MTMDKRITYRFGEDVSVTVEQLGYSQIGSSARFIFRTPVIVNPDEYLETENGTWFKIVGDGERIELQGKWDR